MVVAISMFWNFNKKRPHPFGWGLFVQELDVKLLGGAGQNLGVGRSLGSSDGAGIGSLDGSGGSGLHVTGGAGLGSVQQLDAGDAQALLALGVAVGVHIGAGGDGVHGLQLGALLQQGIHTGGSVGGDESLQVEPVDTVLAVGALVVLADSQAHQDLLGTVTILEELGVAAQTADGDAEVTRIGVHSETPFDF